MAEKYKALLKFEKNINDKDAKFEVIAILDSSGNKKEDNPKKIFPEGKITIKDYFNNQILARDFKNLKTTEIIEANLNIKKLKGLPYVDDFDGYDVKKVKYFYNTQWITESENLFYSTTKKIIFELKKYKELIPIDIKANRIYDSIKLVDDLISPLNEKSSEIKIYDYHTQNQLIQISSKKDIFCMTSNAYRNVEKTEVSSIDFIKKEDLKNWLSNYILSKEKNKKNVDELISILDNNVTDSDDTVKSRIQRCQFILKRNNLSKEFIEAFLKQTDWYKKLDDEKKVLLDEARKEAKKEALNEKAAQQSLIEDELRTYRDVIIQKRIEEQKETLNKLNDKINNYNQTLKDLESLLSSKDIELSKLNSTIQTQTIKLVHLNEDNLATLEKLEKNKKNFIDFFEAHISQTNQKGHSLINSSELSFAMDKNSIDLEEYDDLYSIINLKIDRKLKEDIIKPLYSFASIIPDISYAYTLAHFAGNCHVKVITIEHGWYHFEEFKKAGLIDFLNKAFEKPEDNYLIILQNINMIPIRSALQPLIDIINGSSIFFPEAVQNGIPENIRIIATVLPFSEENDLGIPLDFESYSYFTFVGNPKDRLSLKLSEILAYKAKKHINFSSIKKDWKKDESGFERYSAY